MALHEVEAAATAAAAVKPVAGDEAAAVEAAEQGEKM